MPRVIFGSGVQGTVFGIRLARAGHSVTLVARGKRAAELLCFVLVRREQIEEALHDLAAARAIDRIIFIVGHVNGSDDLFATAPSVFSRSARNRS